MCFARSYYENLHTIKVYFIIVIDEVLQYRKNIQISYPNKLELLVAFLIKNVIQIYVR